MIIIRKTRCIIIDQYLFLYQTNERATKLVYHPYKSVKFFFFQFCVKSKRIIQSGKKKEKFQNEIESRVQQRCASFSSSLLLSPFLGRSRKQNIGASQSEKGSTMHVARLAIHRRQLASFFPQRTKVRDNRYVGAASRTLTLGDPIFRSLPSLPFDGPLCLCSRRFLSLLASLSLQLLCQVASEKLSSSSSPPRRLITPPASPAPSQVFLFISGVARVPRLRNPRSLSPPCAHAALCGRLVACHRCNRGRGLTSASNIVTLEKASYMYMYIHIYIYKSRFPNRFRTIPLTFHGTPSEQVTFPPAFLQISDRSLPFSRRCNDTFNCSSLNRGCHEQSEHQK